MKKITGIIILVVSLFAYNAEAKWWIFGASPNEIEIRYLYLNNMSYDAAGQKISLPRETLQDGMIFIKGKATVQKGKIASVRITTDNKETWKDAMVSDDGAFVFSFKPEAGKVYAMYIEIMDTTGKTNDIEVTRKEVTVSEQNILAMVKNVLDQMIEAYRNKEAGRFMSFVSDDFAGDEANLDRAIRKDFSAFDNIDLRYIINNIATDPKGMIFVSLNYNRSLISSKTGRLFTDKGLTEFTFKAGDKGPLVFSMRNPLIFGVTDASNVATGMVRQSPADPMLIVDERGNVAKVPINIFEKVVDDDNLLITSNPDGTITVKSSDITVVVNQQGAVVSACGGSGTVESGVNMELVSIGHPPYGFDFESGDSLEAFGDFVVTGGETTRVYVTLKTGVSIKDMGSVSLNSISEAPQAGYSPLSPVYLYLGKSYAFKLANGKFGLLEIKNIILPHPPYTILKFDYKYQPDGSRCF